MAQDKYELKAHVLLNLISSRKHPTIEDEENVAQALRESAAQAMIECAEYLIDNDGDAFPQDRFRREARTLKTRGKEEGNVKHV